MKQRKSSMNWGRKAEGLALFRPREGRGTGKEPEIDQPGRLEKHNTMLALIRK